MSRKNIAAILTVLLSYAFLPQLIITDAYAGRLGFNYEDLLWQYLQLLVIPLTMAIVLLGIWRFGTKPDVKYVRS